MSDTSSSDSDKKVSMSEVSQVLMKHVAQLFGGQQGGGAPPNTPQPGGIPAPPNLNPGQPAAPPAGGQAGGGPGSAPPPVPAGQPANKLAMGAPNPQGGLGGGGQGYGGWGQPAAPPMQQTPPAFGGGAPHMAVAQQQYQMPKMPEPPSWDDAIEIAEKMNGQEGFAPVGAATKGINLSPQVIGDVMDKLNEQYKIQGQLHQGLWTGQLAAAHEHNQEMVTNERMKHDDATEQLGRAALGAKTDQGQQKIDEAKSVHAQRAQEAADKVAQLQKKLDAETDIKTKQLLQGQLRDAKRDALGAATVGVLAGQAEQDPAASKAAMDKYYDERKALEAGPQGGGTQASEAQTDPSKVPMGGTIKHTDGKTYKKVEGGWQEQP